MEKSTAWPVRLDPFAIQDKLRDSSLAHMTDKLLRGAGSVLDVNLGISDLVFFEEFLGFAAIAAPRSRIKQKRHPTIIPTALFLHPQRFRLNADGCPTFAPAYPDFLLRGIRQDRVCGFL
jgi:hypothetical protein